MADRRQTTYGQAGEEAAEDDGDGGDDDEQDVLSVEMVMVVGDVFEVHDERLDDENAVQMQIHLLLKTFVNEPGDSNSDALKNVVLAFEVRVRAEPLKLHWIFVKD